MEVLILNIVLLGLLIPFIGTALGSACVFFMHREMKDWIRSRGYGRGLSLVASDSLHEYGFFNGETCVHTSFGRFFAGNFVFVHT